VQVLYLDAAQRLISDETLREGGIDTVAVEVRAIVGRALDLGASGLILAHNHPSGDPQPSAADRQVTVRVATALRAIDVRLLDHLIIARNGTVSFAALGLL
jgi:DNA repair protein RadC